MSCGLLSLIIHQMVDRAVVWNVTFVVGCRVAGRERVGRVKGEGLWVGGLVGLDACGGRRAMGDRGGGGREEGRGG